MMPNPPSVTRSVIAGLLLAALSAGSLIGFSLIAGSADDPTGATVAATRPDLGAPAVVLGTRITRDAKPGPPRAEEAAQTAQTEVRPRPTPTDDVAVLGMRLRNEGVGRNGDGSKKRDVRTDRSSDKKDRDKKDGAQGHATTARQASGSACRCKAGPDNTPNGNAYGYYKGPSRDGSGGVARGHDKGSEGSGGPPASPPGKARGRSKKP